MWVLKHLWFIPNCSDFGVHEALLQMLHTDFLFFFLVALSFFVFFMGKIKEVHHYHCCYHLPKMLSE